MRFLFLPVNCATQFFHYFVSSFCRNAWLCAGYYLCWGSSSFPHRHPAPSCHHIPREMWLNKTLASAAAPAGAAVAGIRSGCPRSCRPQMAKISLLFMKQRLSFHHNSDLIRRRVAETRRVIAVSSLCESGIVRGRERRGNMPELIDVDRGCTVRRCQPRITAAAYEAEHDQEKRDFTRLYSLPA